MRLRCLLALAVCCLLQIALADDANMAKMCSKLAPDHCENSRVKTICASECGGGGGGGGGGGDGGDTPAPDTDAPPPDDEVTSKPTHKPTKHTKAPTSNKPANKASSCDKVSPCVSAAEANARFLKRCQALQPPLHDGCNDHCRYDEGPADLKNAFLKGPCKLDQLRPYLMASSDQKDHTYCCQQTGVLSQKKTAICTPFCNPAGPVWPAKNEALKYAPCAGVLTGIQNCHFFGEEP